MADELWVGTRKGLFALRPEASGSWRTLSEHLPPVYCVRFVQRKGDGVI